MKKILWLVLLLSLVFPQGLLQASPESATKKEILNLKQKLNNELSQNTLLQEKYYKHKLAKEQAKLLILTTSSFIYRYHNGKRSFQDINQFVTTAYECSFVFPELGKDHLERFKRFMGWGEGESNFDKNCVSSWKKGQKLRKLHRNSKGKVIRESFYYIKYDSTDYGILQVNEHNLLYVKKTINTMYKSGTLPFKVKRVRTVEDLFDIPTNCAARCFIETDRKQMGWEYKHDSSIVFLNELNAEINKLKSQEMYDTNLVENYYNLIPPKTYTGTK